MDRREPDLATRLYRRSRQLARERVWYERNRRQHLLLYRPNPARAPDADLLASLIDDGVAVVPDFLPPAVIERIVAEVRPAVEALAEGRYDGPLRTQVGDEDGLFRIYEVDSLSPSSKEFFDSPFLADLADSLCRPGMHSKDRYVDYKSRVDAWDKSVAYHIDHWKVRFKAFLLLQDVTEAQAPLVYMTGSHRNKRWRQRWEWRYQTKEAEGAIISAKEVRRLARRHGYQERAYTGRAGDLIVADTRGIHRGNLLKSGTRMQLVNLYVMNGPQAYAC
jgi:hypothetical protein